MVNIEKKVKVIIRNQEYIYRKKDVALTQQRSEMD